MAHARQCHLRLRLPSAAVNLIAMATPEDMRADAEHIRMADQFVEVPGGKNSNNYANVLLIAAMAMRTGVDAVWPGWWAWQGGGGGQAGHGLGQGPGSAPRADGEGQAGRKASGGHLLCCCDWEGRWRKAHACC